MVGRRKTRRESEAFLARLEGKSSEDRVRLTAQHTAYLNGERETDADFGNEAAGATQTTTVAATKVRQTTTAMTRGQSIPALPSRPPVGKTASYIAAAKKLRAARLAAKAKAEKKPGKGKKKMTKAQREALAKERNAFKEMEAVARVESISARRDAEKARERAHVVDEERSGAEARQAALKALAAARRKESSKSPAAKKQKKTASPHLAEPVEDSDADDESMLSASKYVILDMLNILH